MVPQMLHNHHNDEGTGKAQVLKGRSNTASNKHYFD